MSVKLALRVQYGNTNRSSGAETSANLKVRGKLSEQLVELIEKEGGDSGPPRCYFIDPKCGSNLKDFRSLPVGDSSMYKALATALFDKGLFRAVDFVVLPDGRCPKNGSMILKEVLKPGKKVLPARPSVQIRLMHDNAEFFSEGGAFRKRKGKTLLHAYLPDPLETVHLVAMSDFFKNIQEKERKFVDLPGTNGARGWAKLSLRVEIHNPVTEKTKDLIFSSSSNEQEQWDEEAEAEEACLALCPWEAPERTYAEFLHCFGSPDMVVIDLCPGSGMLCTAACRAGLRYHGFTSCLLQTSLVRESATCQSISVMLACAKHLEC